MLYYVTRLGDRATQGPKLSCMLFQPNYLTTDWCSRGAEMRGSESLTPHLAERGGTERSHFDLDFRIPHFRITRNRMNQLRTECL